MPEMRQARTQAAVGPSADPEVKAELKAEPMDTLEGAGSIPNPLLTEATAPVTATVAGVAGTLLRPLANGAAVRAAPEGASGAKPQRARRRPLDSDSEEDSDEEDDSEEDDEVITHPNAISFCGWIMAIHELAQPGLPFYPAGPWLS